MKWWVLFITFFFMLYQNLKETETGCIHESIKDPDTYRNISEIIASKGYSVEDHTVQTADGYLLSVQRIPRGRKSSSDGQENEVVLLIHGVLHDATIWVMNFPGQSLGFILPDEGYDVWLLNTRGSDYSKSHVKYKTHQRQFWNFSFDEVAKYDIPATIDYILKVSGKEALHIVAYSQGTMSSFAMLSDMPVYNDKVKLLVALAPIGFLRYFSSPILLFTQFKHEIAILNDLFSHGEFSLDNQFIKMFNAQFFYKDGQEHCVNIIFDFAGVDRTQLNKTRQDVYASRFPSSTSTKNILHITQLVESGKFRKYDHGRRLNRKYYQQEEPPDYNTLHITTPVALIWSTNDFIADPEDVDLLRKSLNSIVFDYRVPYPYNHLDFVLAENAVQLIYEPILQLLAKYRTAELLSA